jgi:fucose permease
MRSAAAGALRGSERTTVVIAYAGFVLVGVNAGATGVLLPAQIADYRVSKAAIGTTFFTGSAGFVLASLLAGVMIHRVGMRITLVVGATVTAVAGFYVATRPPFAAFVLIAIAAGFGTGVAESGFQSFVVALPGSTALLNRLHAFFGVGALLGPLLATWILGLASWRTVWFVLAATQIPLVIAVWATYSRDETAVSEPGAADEPEAKRSRGLLATALRERSVLLGALLLAVYVGLEISIGNWGFSYLVQARGEHRVLAGYTVSGYWLGLTLGRFLISPFASRIGASAANMAFGCLAGVTIVAALTWLLPGAASIPGFVLMGFFLGPIFPTAMAMVPNLTPSRLVPTAIGVMNAGSVVGGSALPWLAGAIGQGEGAWTLLPFSLTLAVVTAAVWWLMVVPRGERAGYTAAA